MAAYKKIQIVVERNCIFCKKKSNPDFKQYKDLFTYLSNRAKILGKDKTGICSKHQKRLAVEIKRARHLGLLPFVPGV